MDDDTKELIDILVEYDLNNMTVSEMMTEVMEARTKHYMNLPEWEVKEIAKDLYGSLPNIH